MARHVAVSALLRSFPRAQQRAVLDHVGLAESEWERGHACWTFELRRSGDDAATLLGAWSDDAFDRAWATLQADPRARASR